MKKIAIIGAHNSGKITSLYYLSYKLKKIGRTIGIGHEVARECPYPLNEEGGMLTQLWILFKQIEREAQLEKNYNKIILDRSVYDSIVYSTYLTKRGKMDKKDSKFARTTALAWAENHPYHSLIYLEPLPLELDPQRGQNIIEYQQAIHEEFKLLIKRVPSKVIILKKAPKEKRCKQVYKIVKGILYKEDSK